MGPYTRFFWLISSLDFVLSSVIYESKLLPQSLVRLELNQNKLRLSFFLVIFFAGLPILCQSFTKVNSFLNHSSALNSTKINFVWKRTF